ncbi:hypothetical protein [Corynebacterium sp. TAE3-ERU2]|uniref:hypothetical protein n=1 Tax=Corynebacterium sp. TAE3-ERU2 TaxID=2849497 RepID=UPI001C449454|nr:hypothetical protein [Corynebacterium sp. TAE3-ERU2]MBV7302110.1 hypothetical protein [Corynebacterium sp. TAE3-ERU2]
MSDQQLTVAELLARASKENGDQAPRKRRRRRRSLEEGGVSVAELTGSIPKVDKTPEQPKHTSQPIDAENTARTSEPAPEAAPPAPEQSAVQQQESVDKPASAPVEEQKPEGFSPKLNRVPRGAAAKDKDETMVLDVVQEGEEPRLTTDTFKAVSPEQAQQAAAPQPETAPEPVESIERSPESEGTRSDEPPTATLEAVRDEHAGEQKQRVAPYMAAPEQPAAQPDAEPAEAPAAAAEEESERSVSIPAIIGMTVVAVVIGIAIFKGFELLWANFSNLITGVLALAVTGGIVGIVHAMRTDRDKLTMLLAAVVGLVLTFGPSLIAGL